MICKEDFMDIVNAAGRTLRSIQRLEEALGGIDLTTERISDYLNMGDVIAIHLLEMRTPEDEEMDAFIQSYWNLVQGDESILTFRGNQGQKVIHDSEMFYDFWAGRKENFPILCEVYRPHEHGNKYSWNC
jgi:hypothetical protein